MEWRGTYIRYIVSAVFHGKDNKNWSQSGGGEQSEETESRMIQNNLLVRYVWSGRGGETNDPNDRGSSNQIINDVI